MKKVDERSGTKRKNLKARHISHCQVERFGLLILNPAVHYTAVASDLLVTYDTRYTSTVKTSDTWILKLALLLFHYHFFPSLG